MKAFVFPGQGSQKVGMGLALYRRSAIARRVFDEADEVLGFSLSSLCFEGPEEELQLTRNSQPALLATSVAVLRVLEEATELRPDVVAGHSLGEYSALVCAGAMGFADALSTVRLRGEYMQKAVPVGEGAMVAILGLDTDAVERICRAAAEGRILVPANFNGGRQVVLSGHADAVERAVALTAEEGGVARLLPVSAPFHSPLMEPAGARLGEVLEALSYHPPRMPVISNVEATPNRDEGRIAELLTEQVTRPVRWEETVRAMATMGVTETWEIGSGNVLTRLIPRIDRSIAAQSVESLEAIEELRTRFPRVPRASAGRPDAAGGSHWREAADGSRIDAAAGRILWADGTEEEITEERWHIHASGVKVRKWGGMRVVWADGTLEILSPDEWAWRIDGSLMRKDCSRRIGYDGTVEDFDLGAWEIAEDGMMRRKDGRRTIWPDGLELDLDDPAVRRTLGVTE